MKLLAASALLVPLLATEAASAQQVVYAEPAPVQQAAPEEAGDVRFRGGIGVEGGALIVTGAGLFGTVGQLGVAGQLGVQVNNNWGVYGVPSVDIAFGNGGAGFTVGAAAMAEYMFDDPPLALAAGPEVGALLDVGGSAVLYGARARVAFYPGLKNGPGRRKGLFVAVDVRVEALDGLFFISPLASIGYAAF